MEDGSAESVKPIEEEVEIDGCERAVLRTYDFSRVARPAGAVSLGSAPEIKLGGLRSLGEKAKILASVTHMLLTHED